MIRAGLIIATLLTASPLAARDIALGWPLDCTLGESCFIQNYPDADPGPGAVDFACGVLTYDAHKGVDISLNDLAAMARGHDVVTAAAGVVRAVRDGEPDNATPRPGKECGNGVLIDHGGGWQSQYCHMKQGSIQVEVGARLPMGAMLGEVGLSGRTEFPHLHFALRHDGTVVDPFNPEGGLDCADPGRGGLWLDDIAYQPGGLINAGMATNVPQYDAIKAGLENLAATGTDAPALVVWAYAYGAKAGDIVRLAIKAPDGTFLVRREVTIERDQARMFRAIGKRRPEGGWQAGMYRGESQLVREGVAVGPALVREIEIIACRARPDSGIHLSGRGSIHASVCLRPGR